MKLSFSTMGSPLYSMDQIIGLAASNGYHGIELRAVSGSTELETLPDFSGSGLRETAAKIKAAGLETVCVGTSVRFNKASKQDQQHNLELARVYMDIARSLGSNYIRIFGGPLIPTQGYEESLRWIREGCDRLGVLAKEMEVIPLMETHDDFSTSARVGDILDHLSADNIGLIWDILHPYRFGESMSDTYAALKDKILHVHIKDSVEFSPKGFDIALVGEGKAPITECISLLKAGGYDAYLSFEWEKLWHPEIPDAEIAIPHYAKVMAKYLA